MKIFSEIERFDTRAANHSEPIFSYLDYSARLPVVRIRGLIETWFYHYPSEEQRELLPRLQSKDDLNFFAAFFELYIHEILTRLDYEVRVHPPISEGSDKHPDFLVQGNGEDFYVEVVTSSEQSKKETVSDIHKKFLLDKINEIQSALFFAHIQFRGNPSQPLKSRSICKELRDWFDGLNYDVLADILLLGGLMKCLQKGSILSRAIWK